MKEASIPQIENLTPEKLSSDSGFSLLEVLVSISLLALSGLAISSSAIHAIRTLKFVEINHIANSLAISKMEELAALDTIDIVSGLSATENAVAWPGSPITYTRGTTVVENADGSRTVTISVTCNDQNFPTNVTFNNTFALWE